MSHGLQAPQNFEARNDEREIHQVEREEGAVVRERQQVDREARQEAREDHQVDREAGQVIREAAAKRRVGVATCPVCALPPTWLWGGIITFAVGVGSTLAIVSILSVNVARLEAKTEAVEKAVYRIEAKLDLSSIAPARAVVEYKQAAP